MILGFSIYISDIAARLMFIKHFLLHQLSYYRRTNSRRKYLTLDNKITYSTDTLSLLAVVFLLLGVTYTTSLLLSSTFLPLAYSDELYYIRAGRSYVYGQPISEINWEHPPLAKYIIGVSAVYLGDPHIVTYIAGYASVLIFYFTLLKISGDKLKSLISTVIITTEIPFVKVFNYALLDDFAILFSSAAFYLAITNAVPMKERIVNTKLLLLEGAFWGAAIASKWSAAYLLIARIIGEIVLHEFKRKDFSRITKRLVLILASTTLIYIVFFFDDISRSFELFITHNLRMLNFMSVRHSITIHTVIHGLSQLFFKATFWHRYPDVYLTLTVINSTIVNQSMRLVEPPFTIELNILPTFGAFLLPLIPYVLIYCLVQFKHLSMLQKYLFIIAIGSLIPVLHGTLPWYYVYASYFWGLLISSLLPRKYLGVLLLINISYYAIMTILGLNNLIIVGL